MKKRLAILPLLVFILFSCGDNNTEIDPLLYFENDEFVFDVGGGVASVLLYCPSSSWTITNNTPWLTLSPTTDGGTSRIQITVNANNLLEDRSVVLTAQTGNIIATLTVTQKGRSSIIEFKDPRFLNAILSSRYHANPDRDNDGQISEMEAANTLELSLDNYNRPPIRNMDEISYFTALKEFSCLYNEVTSLDVSKNIELTALHCSFNQLASLDLSKNIALTLLQCDWNNLKSIDLSKNTLLTIVTCEHNQISSLNLSKNIALTYLKSGYNSLVSLDVSNNIEITELWCHDNQLTSLDVSKNRKLTMLLCSNNPLKTLTLNSYHDINNEDMNAIKRQYPNLEINYVD